MMVKSEIWTVAKTDQGNAVLVKPLDEEKAIPIFIGPLEAQNILLGLGDVEIPRPLTHDLTLHLITQLGARLTQVNIHTLAEGTFYANIILIQNEKTLELDARPSDALALAVRSSCPIFLNHDLIDEAGIPLEELRQSAQAMSEEIQEDASFETAPPVTKEVQIFELKEKLDKLVAQEEYEEAAKIRDQIKLLELPEGE